LGASEIIEVRTKPAITAITSAVDVSSMYVSGRDRILPSIFCGTRPARSDSS
jgi:hypothetical protein